MTELIGRNLREQRELLGWSQDHTARVLRLQGLMWTRTMLAKVERGERQVGLEEFLLLSLALGPDPVYFLAGRPDEWVALSTTSEARPRFLQALLSGAAKRAQDVRTPSWEPPALDPAWPELGPVDLAIAEAAAAGEAERKAADRLGVSALIVARAARVAWRANLSDERDERVGTLTPKGTESRTIQAVRGHVTRQLLDELRPVIAERKTQRRKK